MAQSAGTLWNVLDDIVGGVVFNEVIEYKSVQFLKAWPLIDVTELPMVTEVNPMQL